MAKPDPDTIGEDWLKVTEARYDSMKHLLQSVRHDIDALTYRIDSTQKSPVLQRAVSPRLTNSPQPESPKSVTNTSLRQPKSSSSLSSKTEDVKSSSTPINDLASRGSSEDSGSRKPDLLANVHSLSESKPDEELQDMVEVDEYMDIRIRDDRNPFNFPQNLIDCAIGSVHSDLPEGESGGDGENKTWRSPSDFSLRDPFEEEQLTQEFERQIATGGHSEMHVHEHLKETDLDDIQSDRFGRDDESNGSLSPAVSPTFEIYAAETVQLKNMLLSNEETVALGLKQENAQEKPNGDEEYQVYDNGHSLTTIDEASEEVEDEWSSSELDSSLNSNEDKKERVSTGMSNIAGKQATANSSSQKSIDGKFELPVSDSTQAHDGQMNAMVDDNQARSTTLKRSTDKEHTFVFDGSTIHVNDANSKPAEVVVLRPKRVDPESPGKHQPTQERPISMGSFRGSLKRTEKSPTGSLHSVISTFSQESMISEADSYVTVCSRMANTGSEDLYTTACSDSELPVPPSHNGLSAPDDECPTLSRRRTKLPRGQRNRARERRADRASGNSPLSSSTSSSSSSSLEDRGNLPFDEADNGADETIVRTPQPIVVTPKFSRLPSKIASPKDSTCNLLVQEKLDHPVNNVITERDSQVFKFDSSKLTPDKQVDESSCHKRAALQRPPRQSPMASPEPLVVLRNRDQGDTDFSLSDDSSSSGSSSSGDEADYDASEPLVWTAYPMGVNFSQPGTVLPPNLVYKPSLQAQFDLTEMQRKRLSRIEEVAAGTGGSSSANEAGESDSDDSPPVGNGAPNARSEPSSDERQSDSGVVIIPKYTYESRTPEQLETALTSSGRCISLSTRHSSGDCTWASTPAKPTLPMVDQSQEPINEQQKQSKQQRQQHPIQTSSTNPLQDRTSGQSESDLCGVYVPPLAGRVMNRRDESRTEQDNSGGIRVQTAHSEGNRVTETSQPLSADQQRLNELDSADKTAIDRAEMYGNTNYYYPPESTHIYNDRIRAGSKPNGSTDLHPTASSSMKTNVPVTQADRTALPLAAVLASAEATAARPSVYSPMPSESDESRGLRRSFDFQHPAGSATTGEHFGTCVSSGDYVSSHPPNSSNGHMTNTNYTSSRHTMRIRTQVDSEPQNHLSEPRPSYSNEQMRQPEPDWDGERIYAQRRIRETGHAWPPVQATGNESDRCVVVRSPLPPVPFEHPEPNQDIQVASQRTSRIVHGTVDYLDASVKLVMGPQVPIPQQPERSYISSPMMSESQDGTDWTPAQEEYKHISNTSYPLGSTPNGTGLPSPLPFVERSIPVPHGNRNMNPQQQSSRAIQLMQAPKYTGNMATEPEHVPETRRVRNISPSPPRTVAGVRPLIPRPLEVVTAQPKWQLRPIPTETEIRERLRSRSRQRVEERQSRSQRPEINQTQTYRPRSSRSDSRYRCTDLDSAIAESRADTAEMRIMHSSVHESESLSEAKQSASLFDLDARTHKVSTPIGSRHPTASLTEGNATYVPDAVKSERKFFGDAKSYNSLLETDIDTGENFERPLVLETDVDRLDTRINSRSIDLSLDNKTQSLFNLTFAHTPGPYRRQNTVELHSIDRDVVAGRIGRSESPGTHGDNWQRTKSLQGLPHRGQESPGPKAGESLSVLSHQSRANGIGAKGLIERLRERAKSSYELRIAQSLSKLRVPDWLDKAECLSRTSIHDPDAHTAYPDMSSKITAGTTINAARSRALLPSTRSLSSSRKPADYASASKWLRKSPLIETVAEPTWPRAVGSQGTTTTFIRPSQQFRERGDSLSRLKPIRSKLYSSMRSLAASRPTDGPQTPEVLRPQVAPRLSRNKPNGFGGQATAFQLSPQDFLPRHEQLWGRNTDVLPRRYSRSNTEPRDAIAAHVEAIPISYEYPDDGKRHSFDSDAQYHTTISASPPPPPPSANTQLKNTHTVTEDDIKPADYDSGTEHSSEHRQLEKHVDLAQRDRVANFKQPGAGSMNGTTTPTTKAMASNLQLQREWENNDPEVNHGSHGNRPLDQRHSNPASPRTESVQSEQTASEWRSIDAEGESESEATDGLDQISDLTCLTNLIDTCATRHRALLANRPSALEHLLTSLGWWPSSPSAEHQHSPPTAAEAISIAAHEFDVEEDSHRVEFIQLLTGPESRRPINLGEFALNHLSGAVQRKQHDGLLYISCGRAECTKSPVQVTQATDWRACANCYTLYCSTTCRALDRRALHDHPTVCSFARAKRVCNRVLRNLAAGQITGLTALAKTGMARLGRGGILLPFALIRHAEMFLRRAQSQAWNNAQAEGGEASVEQAAACWEQTRQPSPGGLIAPPLYLTLQELQQLDSTVANPCRTYAPSTSMVLIIVVCAYELIARADGRPVHLFKQSLVLPFPAHNLPNGKRQSVGEKSASGIAPAIPDKPIMPQTNGLLGRPDRQAAASREAYMIRLQRMLRERGVSLRHHHPEIYTQIANFVETGVPFSPIRISFHDFVLREEVLCVIRPMHDPQIYSIRQMQSQAAAASRLTDCYEEVHKERSNGATAVTHPNSKSHTHSTAAGHNTDARTAPASSRGLDNYPRWQETNF